MPNPLLEQLRAEVAKNTDVAASATILINGFAARVKAAVDKALAGGVSAEELAAAVTAEVAAIQAASGPLAQAVVENTEANPGEPTPVERPRR